MKSKYEMLAIFQTGEWIPAEVLSVFWDEDEVEAEDTMEEFAQRSLAKIHPSIDCNHCFKCFCNRVTYSVHDIQLKFLKEYATSNRNLQKYHKLLTDRYSAQCDGDFSKIKDDGYIHWTLISHLLSGGQ